jgi:hypothetical protein
MNRRESIRVWREKLTPIVRAMFIKAAVEVATEYASNIGEQPNFPNHYRRAALMVADGSREWPSNEDGREILAAVCERVNAVLLLEGNRYVSTDDQWHCARAAMLVTFGEVWNEDGDAVGRVVTA